MATKLKNTKPIVKTLVIILSVILAVIAFFFATNVALIGSYFYDGKAVLSTNLEEDGYTITDMRPFDTYIRENLCFIDYMSKDQKTDKIRETLKTYRSDYIDKGYAVFMEYKNNNDPVGEDYDPDYDDYYMYEFYYDVLPNGLNGVNVTISYLDYSEQLGILPINANMTEKEVKENLGKVFDYYLSLDRLYSDQYGTYGTDDISEGFFYYVKDAKTGKVLSNLPKGVKKEDIKNFEHHYCYNNGKKDSTAIFNGVLNYDVLDYINKSEYYAYVDTNTYLYNEYANTYNLIKNINVRAMLVMSIVLGVLSLGLAIYSFCVVGKRKEDGKIKLLFLDYIPSDLHLAISAGGIFGLVMLMADLLNGVNHYSGADFIISILLSAISAGAIWLLFIEQITSIVRVSKSEKHLWKNLLVVWIFTGIFKLFQKIGSKIKNAVSYKPVNFKKRLIGFLVGYGIINVFLVIMEFVWIILSYYDEGAQVMGILNAMFIFGINILSVVFVTRYVVSLDKIITSAHNRTPLNIDYNKLPNSLKILVNSINYSNQELQSAVQKAVKDERMRTELITNVSHDLKTPLTSIINYVDLLEQCDIDDENAKEYIAVLDEKGGKLKRLIEDLIETSKVTSGVITLNPTNLNLSELATQAVVEHQKEFEENHLELMFKGDRDSVFAYSDGVKTYRVIENLLSNARKYSAKGTRVYADVYTANNTAIFEIKNISAQPLDITPQELTERFVRGDKSRTAEGNGLGLSIAENLCKAMGGRLELVIDGDLFKARVILPIK